MNPNDWIVGRDTGLSSTTIWGVMMGARVIDPSVPYDPDDFGRCYRLLALFPEWRLRLHEVATAYPEWIGLVREWDKLTELYRQEFPSGSCPKLYWEMQQLINEGRIAAGWKNIGPGSWQRGKQSSIEIAPGISVKSK